MSWARSVVTCRRHTSTRGGLALGPRPRPSSARRTTRSRNGGPAPSRRELSRSASTGSTAISSLPSRASCMSACNEARTGPSARQLTPRVCRVVATSAALR